MDLVSSGASEPAGLDEGLFGSDRTSTCWCAPTFSKVSALPAEQDHSEDDPVAPEPMHGRGPPDIPQLGCLPDHTFCDRVPHLPFEFAEIHGLRPLCIGEGLSGFLEHPTVGALVDVHREELG